jgi:hypothetical protein
MMCAFYRRRSFEKWVETPSLRQAQGKPFRTALQKDLPKTNNITENVLTCENGKSLPLPILSHYAARKSLATDNGVCTVSIQQGFGCSHNRVVRASRESWLQPNFLHADELEERGRA